MMLLRSILIITMIGGAVRATPPASVTRPNILVILVDDVGREVLGCYGGESYKTPNIDYLANSGTRFNQAYVMPMCHPTRICLMTGQYPFRLGEPAWGTFPKQSEPLTLGNIFKSAGYHTVISGKWQLTLLKDDLEQPNRMGFDEYCLDGWHEGPWYYQPRIWQNGKLRDDVRDRYGPDVTCDFLINYIVRRRSEPFFAYYTMELCHDETNDLDRPAPFGPLGRYETYAEMVQQMDQRVGRVITALDKLNLRRKTLVVFLADNGTPPRSLVNARNGKYEFQDFESKMNDKVVRGGKGQLTDWGTHVPLIVNWPKQVAAGQTSDALFDASDLLPTLADIAGAQLPGAPKVDGVSMADHWRGSSPPRDHVFIEYNGRAFVRNQEWKLYTDDLFYDMRSDPNEREPLATANLTGDAQTAYTKLHQYLGDLPFSPTSHDRK